jgi:hypothetical protein
MTRPTRARAVSQLGSVPHASSISVSTDCVMKNTESEIATSGMSTGVFAGKPMPTASAPRAICNAPSDVRSCNSACDRAVRA